MFAGFSCFGSWWFWCLDLLACCLDFFSLWSGTCWVLVFLLICWWFCVCAWVWMGNCVWFCFCVKLTRDFVGVTLVLRLSCCLMFSCFVSGFELLIDFLLVVFIAEFVVSLFWGFWFTCLVLWFAFALRLVIWVLSHLCFDLVSCDFCIWSVVELICLY